MKNGETRIEQEKKNAAIGSICILRQQRNLMGWWVQKMAIFEDVQYCIYTDIVRGLEKVLKCANII